MADRITADLDVTPLLAAIDRLGRKLEARLLEDAGVTAKAIVSGARTRLERLIGPDATGATERGIVAYPDKSGHGWIVESSRDTKPFVPLVIEKGSKRGKKHSHKMDPRAYFYPAAIEQEGSHRRRVEGTIQDAIDEEGFG